MSCEQSPPLVGSDGHAQSAAPGRAYMSAGEDEPVRGGLQQHGGAGEVVVPRVPRARPRSRPGTRTENVIVPSAAALMRNRELVARRRPGLDQPRTDGGASGHGRARHSVATRCRVDARGWVGWIAHLVPSHRSANNVMEWGRRRCSRRRRCKRSRKWARHSRKSLPECTSGVGGRPESPTSSRSTAPPTARGPSPRPTAAHGRPHDDTQTGRCQSRNWGLSHRPSRPVPDCSAKISSAAP